MSAPAGKQDAAVLAVSLCAGSDSSSVSCEKLYVISLDLAHFIIFLSSVTEHFEFQVAIFVPRLPGDSRTRIGFMTFDSTIHFYNLQEGLSQPQMLIVSDIDGKLQQSSLCSCGFEVGAPLLSSLSFHGLEHDLVNLV